MINQKAQSTCLTVNSKHAEANMQPYPANCQMPVPTKGGERPTTKGSYHSIVYFKLQFLRGAFFLPGFQRATFCRAPPNQP